MKPQKLTDRYPDKHIVDCKIQGPRHDPNKKGRDWVRAELAVPKEVASLLVSVLLRVGSGRDLDPEQLNQIRRWQRAAQEWE